MKLNERKSQNIVAVKLFFENHPYKEDFEIYSNDYYLTIVFRHSNTNICHLSAEAIRQNYKDNYGMVTSVNTGLYDFKLFLPKSVAVTKDYSNNHNIEFHQMELFDTFTEWENINWRKFERKINDLISQFNKVQKKMKEKVIKKKLNDLKWKSKVSQMKLKEDNVY